MTYATVKAAILAHCVTAGATLTPPIADVKSAFPLPKGRCVRVYYGGEADPVKMGARWTLNSEMIAKRTMIAAFWPISTLSEDLAAAIDAEAEAFGHSLRGLLDGDAQLGGTTTDSALLDAAPDIFNVNGARFLGVVWEHLAEYTEYSRAA